MPSTTRNRIVMAALDLFYERGYEATSLKQVAAAAGAHGGSVYHFFPTKADLVEAVLEKYRELLDPVLMAPVRAATTDPIERVMQLLAGYRANLVATGFSGGCPIGALALELAASHPRALDLVVENFDGWSRAVAAMLDEVGLPPDVSSGDVASFVLTVMEGAVMQAKSYRRIAPFDACVRQLRKYLEGLVVQGSMR